MRRLMLMRHAKAEIPMGLDRDRKLAQRGREAAPLVGAYLKDEQLFPDFALVSPSVRTQQTWELVRPGLGAVEKREEPRLYEVPTDTLLTIVREVDPGIRTLLMVGHNPSIGELARQLVGHGDRYAFARMKQAFPTGALAVIDFAVDLWSEVEPRSGRLDRFVTPGTLGGPEDD